MSTVNTVKTQLQNLIDISNRATGKSEVDLTSVVNTLVNERTSMIDDSLTEYYNPDIINTRQCAFGYCVNLISVSLPNATTFRPLAFYNSTNLKNVYVPSIKTTDRQFVTGCTSLEYLDLHKISNFYGNYTFNQCVKLKTILLRRTNSICALSGGDSFAGTPIESGTGYVYVPRSMIEEYKIATNWVTFASQFRVLEDYTVDGTVDGELDWDKVNGGAA